MNVSPFCDYQAAVLIGNGIGFMTGSIHYHLIAEDNYNKQKARNEWKIFDYMTEDEKLQFMQNKFSHNKQINSFESVNENNEGADIDEDNYEDTEEDNETDIPEENDYEEGKVIFAKVGTNFNNVCKFYKETGGEVLEDFGTHKKLKQFSDTVGGKLLLEICKDMAHSPIPSKFDKVFLISYQQLNGIPSIVYASSYQKGSIGQHVFLFLVRTAERIRFFTIETSFPFALCEYSDGKHFNYGQIENLAEVPSKIIEILDREESL